MTPEKFEEMKQQAKDLAEKVANDCNEHAQNVLNEQDYGMYQEILKDFLMDLSMMAMMGKASVFYESLAALNKIVANAQAGELAWNQANPKDS